MKAFILCILFTFSLTSFADEDRNFVSDKLMAEIDGYGDEEFKKELYKSKSRFGADAIDLNLVIKAYLQNKDLPKNELMFPYKNLSFQDSITGQIKSPDNSSLEMITTVIGQCIYGSMLNKAVLETCTKDELFNRVDHLSDIYEAGAWAIILADLYSVLTIVRDNKAEILTMHKSSARMSEIEVTKDQGPESGKSQNKKLNSKVVEETI